MSVFRVNSTLEIVINERRGRKHPICIMYPKYIYVLLHHNVKLTLHYFNNIRVPVIVIDVFFFFFFFISTTTTQTEIYSTPILSCPFVYQVCFVTNQRSTALPCTQETLKSNSLHIASTTKLLSTNYSMMYCWIGLVSLIINVWMVTINGQSADTMNDVTSSILPNSNSIFNSNNDIGIRTWKIIISLHSSCSHDIIVIIQLKFKIFGFNIWVFPEVDCIRSRCFSVWIPCIRS